MQWSFSSILCHRGPTSPGKLWQQTEGTEAVQWSCPSPSPMWRTSLHSGKKTATAWSYQKTLSEIHPSWYIGVGVWQLAHKRRRCTNTHGFVGVCTILTLKNRQGMSIYTASYKQGCGGCLKGRVANLLLVQSSDQQVESGQGKWKSNACSSFITTTEVSTTAKASLALSETSQNQ